MILKKCRSSWWSNRSVLIEKSSPGRGSDKIWGESMAPASVLCSWLWSSSSVGKLVGCIFSEIDSLEPLSGNRWAQNDNRRYTYQEKSVILSVYASAPCLQDLLYEPSLRCACTTWQCAQSISLWFWTSGTSSASTIRLRFKKWTGHLQCLWDVDCSFSRRSSYHSDTQGRVFRYTCLVLRPELVKILWVRP